MREGNRTSSNQSIDVVTAPIAAPITPNALRDEFLLHPGINYKVANAKTTGDISERNH
jgi:hypothetical protein